MKNKKNIQLALSIYVLFIIGSCTQQENKSHQTVLCVPVYGQSLALGEEAILITNFDSLKDNSEGRIVTENLDYEFGYFDNNDLKLWGKKLIGYQKRSFELSIYGMAMNLINQMGTDTIICTFPGGQGATALASLSKGSLPYEKFMEDIANAYKKAKERGWEFEVPAICYMQGESDIEDYPKTDYKKLLKQLSVDFNHDIKQITHQNRDIKIICYQSNNVSSGDNFIQDSFECVESNVPQTQMELIRDDSLFWASGPTYPYTFERERIHINSEGQKLIGNLAALSALDIIRGKEKRYGVIPINITKNRNEIVIHYNVPVPPLQLDTIAVKKTRNYGFGVITQQNRDILTEVKLEGDSIRLICSEIVDTCKVRYAINGEHKKSGYLKGPRGNLRDSQGDEEKAIINGKQYPLHNWGYQFDILLF